LSRLEWLGSGEIAIPSPLMAQEEEHHLEGNNWFVLGKELFLLFLQGADERLP
jgi:hypothetical protein